MRNKILPLLCVCLLASSCATVKQNVDARALLAKCSYEYAGLSVAGVTFGQGIAIDSVDFNVMVKVTNNADRDIALDHAEFAFFLDRNHVLDLDHKRFARVAPSNSAVEPIAVGLPFADIVKALGHRPEKVGVKAKLWVTILAGKDTWETPVVIPVDVELAIPYDQIDALVAQKQQQLEAEAKAKAEAEAKAKLDEAKARLEAEAKAKLDAAAQQLVPAVPEPPHF